MIKLISICALLLFFHLVTKWYEVRRASIEAGTVPLGFFGFLAQEPAKVSMTVLGSASAFMLAEGIGWLDPSMPPSFGVAGACGYMGSSLTVKIVNQFQHGVQA